MKKPNYVKVSTKPPKNPWPVTNRRAMTILRKIGSKFNKIENSLYLSGSAAGREETERVNDLDLIVVARDSLKIYQAERLARKHKKIQGIKIPITYQFLPLEWISSIDRHPSTSFLGPAYFTYVKVNNICLGGRDFIGSINWPSKQIIKADAVYKVKGAILGLFKEVNKERFTKEQNYLVLKYIREIMFNAMYAQFYFGFSKTEIFKLFLQKYRLKNIKPAKLLYESRQYGIGHFLNQEPKTLQNSCLLFAQEIGLHL